MNKTPTYLLRKQRGQSLVEMALSMIVILMLLAGAINFGIGFFSFVAIRDAAQEGALFGAIAPPLDTAARDEIIARVQTSSITPVNLSETTVTVCTGTLFGDCAADASLCAGDLLQVTVTYNLPITMPLAGVFTGDAIPLTASATSTILKPECSP